MARNTGGCAALAGFVQLGLGISLMVIIATTMHHAGPDSCIYGAADVDYAPALCDSLSLLAFVSVGSSLVISVAQGFLSLLVRAPPRGVEMLSRLALAGAWVVAAILTTIVTVQADKADPKKDHLHWRHVGLGLAWAMAMVASLMGLVTLIGVCCIDVPLWFICCFCPCCPAGQAIQGRGPCCDCGSCLQLSGLACCLYWCLPRSWLPSNDPHHCCEHGHGVGYQPIPPAPIPPLHATPPPHTGGMQRPTQPSTAAGPSYAPPTILPPAGGGPSYYPVPHMAPAYAPFAVGPAPPAVPGGGWGHSGSSGTDPSAPPYPPVPQHQQVAPPRADRYPQVQPSKGAWYPQS